MKSVKEFYRQFLNTKRGVDLYKEFKDQLYGDEDSLVQILNNVILQNLPLIRKDVVSVCDIGGGDGTRIKHILRYLNSKFNITFQLDFIEQSNLYIDAFDSSELDGFGTTVKHYGLFENLIMPRKYDLVLLIHSIFAFDNGKALESVLSLPKEDGIIIVLSNSTHSFLAGLKSIVDDQYEDKRYEINDLRDDLNHKGIPYIYFNFETIWAIPESNYNLAIRTILDWISLGSYESFSQEKKQQIEDYVSRNALASNKRFLFSEKEAVLAVAPVNLNSTFDKISFVGQCFDLSFSSLILTSSPKRDAAIMRVLS